MVTYNIDADTNGSDGADAGPGLTTVLQAVGDEHLAGHAQAIDVLALQDQVQRESQAPTAGQPAPGDALVRFYQSFPQDKDLPLWLEKIFASAQMRKIELDRGEYKVTSDKDGGFVRFQMTFPVKGEYPRIRKYLSSLMSDIPTLSLQQVQFKREKVGDTMVEANIRMVLYLLEQKL